MANADVKWAYEVKIATIVVVGKPSITAVSMKAVLLALADCKNGKTGQCNPKQGYLAERTALSTSTVSRALAGLVQLGLVERVANPIGGGGRAADSYVLNPTNIADDEPRELRRSQTANLAESHDELRNPQVRTSQSADLLLYREPEENQKEPETLKPASIEALFDEAYQSWPKKVDRKLALTRFKIAARQFRGREHELVEAIQRHAGAYRAYVEKQFTPGLAVWLNREGWDNELPEARTRETRTTGDIAYLQDLQRREQAQIGIAQ